MQVILGCTGLGLVWGWVAARLIYRARWDVIVRVLLGLVAQGLITFRLATPGVTIAFGAAVVASALICMTWVRALESRYARTR
ncbi:MAG TPA: hypothetical protein VF909_17630 [Roseiflexaceae bacterium]